MTTPTKGQIAAIVLGLAAFGPDIVELFRLGYVAFEGCKVSGAPFLLKLSAFIAAFNAKRLWGGTTVVQTQTITVEETKEPK